MTPVKPRPLLVPVTSTAFTSAKTSTSTCRPTASSPAGAAELADESLRLATGLGEQLDAGRGTLLRALAVELGDVTTFTAAGQAAGLIEKAELHRFVAIPLLGADLKHVARARFDHRDRDHIARFVVNLRHPDLAAEYSDSHRSVPCGQLPVGRRENLRPAYPARLPVIVNLD